MLRSVFRERWRSVSGLDWDASSNEHNFLSNESASEHRLRLFLQEADMVRKGEVDDWDVPLLCNVILFSEIVGFWSGQPQRNAVTKIWILRNVITHCSTPFLSEERFQTYFNETVAHLRTLGANIDLDALTS